MGGGDALRNAARNAQGGAESYFKIWCALSSAQEQRFVASNAWQQPNPTVLPDEEEEGAGSDYHVSEGGDGGANRQQLFAGDIGLAIGNAVREGLAGKDDLRDEEKREARERKARKTVNFTSAEKELWRLLNEKDDALNNSYLAAVID
eukprot:gene5664-2316_t